MALKAVFFDVGETLVDETRAWAAVAQHHGVPLLTFFGVLGGLVERGEHHRKLHELFGGDRPYYWPDLSADDFYPDALPCLAACKGLGLTVGLAGNQPASTETALRGLGLDVDVIAASAVWGVEKPSPEFYEKVVDAAGCRPHEIAHVGDRVDNDIVQAKAAGLVAVHVVRGPWGWLHHTSGKSREADHVVMGLDEVPGLLA